MSERSQIAAVWWALIFVSIFGLTLIFLLHMLPPPAAGLPAAEVARWYAERAGEIKLGAMISSWTSASIFPMWAVIAVQIARQQGGYGLWSVMAGVGGGMTSLLLVLPPIFSGAAAWNLDRAPEITSALHDLGVLLLVTTDQCYVFCWAAVIVTCLGPQSITNSPFPRWFGYFNIWFVLVAEAGGLAWLTKTGPLAWEGLFPFWLPFLFFGLWIPIAATLLLRALNAQRRAAVTTAEEPVLAA
jgi:hypothetical protein